jgi:low temperature requirement protein LtrA
MLNVLRITTAPSEHEEKTTWLELFFDLIYVAILVVLGDRLSHNLSLQGVVEFALLFIPIWLSWLEPVFYSRRFPTDDIGHRLLTVAYMGVMVSMAFELHDVTGRTATTFLLAYAASKAILALMYARAWQQHPEYRSFAGAHVVLFAILAIVWSAIALWEPTGFPWWAVATAMGLFAPFFMPHILKWVGRPAMDKPPVKAHYVLDRFGELTIIVLGEFFLKAALGAAERSLHADRKQSPAAVLGRPALSSSGSRGGLWRGGDQSAGPGARPGTGRREAAAAVRRAGRGPAGWRGA